MNQAMGVGQNEEDEEDAQDKILKAMQARKMKGNASYLALQQLPRTPHWKDLAQNKKMAPLSHFICIP